MVFWQVGMQKVIGRTFYLEERNREWAWPGCSTTSETFNVLFIYKKVSKTHQKPVLVCIFETIHKN